ncbi:MAG: response regulator [Myxococcota bacterium]
MAVRFTDRFFPVEVVAKQDEGLDRARVLVGFALGLCATAPVLLLSELLAGRMVETTVMAVAWLGAVALLLGVRVGMPSRWLGYGLVTLMMAVPVFVAGMVDGLLAPAILWLLVVTPLTMFTYGSRVGIAVGLLVSGLLVALYFVTPGDPVYGLRVLASLLATTGLLGVLGGVHARPRGRAAEVERAHNDVLASISQEIRTPLNRVLGMLGLLLDEPMSSTQRTYVQTARTSGQSLLGLLSDVLELSRVEAGELELELGPARLRELVAEVVEQVGARAPNRSREFVVRYSSDVPSHVVGDGGRIRQVLDNLVNDAIEHSMCEHVVIRVMRSRRSADEYGVVWVRVEVDGTAAPVSEADRASVSVESRPPELPVSGEPGRGRGLALTIAQKLAALMGGAAGLTHEPDRGPVFWAELPLIVDEVTPGAREERSKTNVVSRRLPRSRSASRTQRIFAGQRVLVVEDNPVNQRGVAMLLERLGCIVDLAGNGREALPMVQDVPYHAVLMDVGMPEMDGLSATRAIRAREGTTEAARVPIVGMSAHALTGDRERGLMAGMDGCVLKPVFQRDLVDTLRPLLTPSEPPAGRAEPVGSSPAEPDPEIFESKRISAVADDLEEAGEMLGMFHRSADNNLSQMQAALTRGDIEAYRHAAHALKGSAGMIGALRLHEALADVMSEDDPVVLATGLRRTREEYEAARAQMDAWLSRG